MWMLLDFRTDPNAFVEERQAAVNHLLRPYILCRNYKVRSFGKLRHHRMPTTNETIPIASFWFRTQCHVEKSNAECNIIKVLHHFAQLCQAQFSCKCSLLRSYTAGTVTRLSMQLLLAVGMQQRSTKLVLSVARKRAWQGN